MNNNPPKNFKWEMSEEDDEAMINESMMLMSYKANMEAARKAKEGSAPEEIRLAEMKKRTEENEEGS